MRRPRRGRGHCRLPAAEAPHRPPPSLRIATARKELNRVEAFDYVIVNREFHLDETVDAIRAIIDAEHHRVHPRKVAL